MRTWYAILLAAVAFLATSPLSATPMYQVTDLGTLPGFTSSRGFAINSSGEVTGNVFNGSGSGNHAFLYSNGVMNDLGTLGGLSYGTAINDSGQVVGYYLDGSLTPRAFLYSDGAMNDLGTLGGKSSKALGINSNGQVTGGSTTSTSVVGRAFLYSGGVMQNLGTLPGGLDSAGIAINASGQVTGNSRLTVDAFGNTINHAILYSGGKMNDLGLFGGTNSVGNGSQGNAINSSGEVTGGFQIANDPNGYSNYAFLDSGGVWQNLGPGGGNAINDSGQVTGQGITLVGGTRTLYAFLYSGGVTTDLNTLISPSSGWILTSGNGINNLGQITGWGTIGGQQHAFLATPVPEPSTILLAGMTLIGILLHALRKHLHPLVGRLVRNDTACPTNT